MMDIIETSVVFLAVVAVILMAFFRILPGWSFIIALVMYNIWYLMKR